MIEHCYDLSREGKISQSDELYLKCYTIAYDMLATYHASFFSDEELNFLNKIIAEFNYENKY